MEEVKFSKAERHESICKGLTELYRRKNADYGDSYAKSRKKRPDVILVRLDDKLSRLETLYKKDALREVEDESIEDTLLDIANYAIMEVIERQVPTAEDYVDAMKAYVRDLENELNRYKEAYGTDFIASQSVKQSQNSVPSPINPVSTEAKESSYDTVSDGDGGTRRIMRNE